MPKETALQKFFKKHRRWCTYFVFSGDRHCSCGRNEALAEVERLQSIVSGLTQRAVDEGDSAAKSIKSTLKVSPIEQAELWPALRN